KIQLRRLSIHFLLIHRSLLTRCELEFLSRASAHGQVMQSLGEWTRDSERTTKRYCRKHGSGTSMPPVVVRRGRSAAKTCCCLILRLGLGSLTTGITILRANAATL